VRGSSVDADRALADAAYNAALLYKARVNRDTGAFTRYMEASHRRSDERAQKQTRQRRLAYAPREDVELVLREEVSENQYAIPAQEETKRSIEETRRFKWRAAIYAPTVLGGIYAMKSCPAENAQWIAIAIVGVLSTVEGAQALDKYLSKRR
jgi:hypothetical protein